MKPRIKINRTANGGYVATVAYSLSWTPSAMSWGFSFNSYREAIAEAWIRYETDKRCEAIVLL
jgi:hypothetical protein